MIAVKKISAGGTQLITSDAVYTDILQAMMFCNSSESAEEVLDLYFLQQSETPSDDNVAIKSCTIAPTNTLVFDNSKITLENGERLYAKSKNGTIVATVSFDRIKS